MFRVVNISFHIPRMWRTLIVTGDPGGLRNGNLHRRQTAIICDKIARAKNVSCDGCRSKLSLTHATIFKTLQGPVASELTSRGIEIFALTCLDSTAL